MTHRQPKLPLAFRIIAAGCVVLWLAWVFTPEVCLGPAFRSLAPPAFI